MAKGWTVEVTSEHSGPRGPRLKLQVFDVAIADQAAALEAAKHQSRAEMIVQALAREQLAASVMLSPGRVRLR